MAKKNKKLNNQAAAPAPEKKKKNTKGIVLNVLYYGFLVLLVVGVFLVSNMGSGGKVKTFGGFAALTVLSSSMEDVYPKDSIILVKETPASELTIGDDITYIANQTTVITHRIIEITENGNGRGGRAFKTKGVNNPNPDSYQVFEENVVGKVIWSSYILGRGIKFVSKNWPLVLFLLAVFVGLIVVLNKILLEDDDEEGDGKSKEAQQPQAVQPDVPSQAPAPPPVQPIPQPAAAPVPAQQPAPAEPPQIIAGPETVADGRKTVVVTISPQKGGKPDKEKAPIIIEITSANPAPVIIHTPDAAHIKDAEK